MNAESKPTAPSCPDKCDCCGAKIYYRYDESHPAYKMISKAVAASVREGGCAGCGSKP